MDKRAIYSTIPALLLACPGALTAGSSAGNMNVTANVPSNLSVSATDLAFGDLSESAATEAQSSITITASGVGTVQIGLNAGLNISSGGDRQMEDGSANSLVYRLYTAADHNTEWGDGNTTHAAAKVSADLTGQTSSIHTVYGVADAYPNGQAIGDYTDTVTVEVTW